MVGFIFYILVDVPIQYVCARPFHIILYHLSACWITAGVPITGNILAQFTPSYTTGKLAGDEVAYTAAYRCWGFELITDRQDRTELAFWNDQQTHDASTLTLFATMKTATYDENTRSLSRYGREHVTWRRCIPEKWFSRSRDTHTHTPDTHNLSISISISLSVADAGFLKGGGGLNGGGHTVA